MNSLDEKVGYLIAKMEEQGESLNKVATKVDYLEKAVNEKFTTVETLIKVFKFAGVATIAIATFKFGDVTKWWDYFFN